MSYLSLQGPVPVSRPRPKPGPSSGLGPNSNSSVALDFGGRGGFDGPYGSGKSELPATPGSPSGLSTSEPTPGPSGLPQKSKKMPFQSPNNDSDMSDGDLYEDVETRPPCSLPGASERRGRSATLSPCGGSAGDDGFDEDEYVREWYRGTDSTFTHCARVFRNTAFFYCPSKGAVHSWIRRRGKYFVSFIVLIVILLICWLLAKYTSPSPTGLPNVDVTSNHNNEYEDDEHNGNHDGRVHHGPHEYGDPNTETSKGDRSYDTEYDYYEDYGHFDHDHHGARRSNRSDCDYDVGTVHHGYASVGRYASTLCELIAYNITRPNGSCSSVCVLHCFHLTAKEYIDIYLENLAMQVGCKNNIDGNFSDSENYFGALTFWFNITSIQHVNLTFKGDSGNVSLHIYPLNKTDHQELIVLYKNETGNNTYANFSVDSIYSNARNVLMFSCNSTEAIVHYVCGTGGMTGMTGIHHTRQTWTHVNVTGLSCNNTIEGTEHVANHNTCS
ncbi:hypothetical protein CRV008 [Nile crocodilepox virus]|uniref:Uncharacterized protein n=1 Tax=Nile crocodilepox virus (isolate Crocodylus niloticus/Zimbabwe/Ume/2001) TaxID=1289473 RepID=Q06ZX2_CPRVZ|nr:hypothetical protein CRV008 [Nile crocodilepox virus]ABJ08899.1 hypothetical protein CRV008 [Nile crocodilepox virus]